MDYKAFLESKIRINNDFGFDIHESEINEKLYDFQKAIVKWAVKKGKAAVFADTGLGKTFVQLEWTDKILKHKEGQGLIVVPLSVANQTIDEAKRINIDIKYCRNQSEADEQRIAITNYERLRHFDAKKYKAIVLDESSILKSVDGKTKNLIFDMFQDNKYKLSCTATPAPNDIVEMANQVQYIGLMTREEMLSKFFVHDQNGWKLKGYAKIDFFRWMASWSVFLRYPSDIGFSDDGFILPELKINALYTDDEYIPDGEMFAVTELKGIGGRLKERKQTVQKKIEILTEKVNNDDKQWLIWCGLNQEADKLTKLIDESKQIKGSDNIEYKIKTINDFKNGKLRVLVTKPKICGFGMNMQNCFKMAFIGLSDSYEYYYQCIRRCWRFGQNKSVDVKIVLSPAEKMILENVLKKEKSAKILIDGVIKEVSDFSKIELGKLRIKNMKEYAKKHEKRDRWEMFMGDSCELIKDIYEDSIDFSVFSPPFAQLYTYSDSERDLGNARNVKEFWSHFDFLIPELLRVIKHGRIVAVHCAQIPAMLVRDGYIGLKDFRGDVIRHFQKAGFIYHGEVCIDKNPQAQSIRTHAKGLTFSQLEKDSSWMRPALADYLTLFRKEGENQTAIINGNIEGAEISRDEWIRLAHPVWYNIRETNTLNVREARSEDDEKHICPLQLETIHNALMLWSNPDELIYSPFAGIGSEGYQAILDNRRFIGCELKREYYNVAIKNLERAEIKKANQGMVLFQETNS